LDQLRRDRRAVHLHERLVGAGRERVEGAGDQLFAGAVFAGDEHARRGGRHLLDALDHALHGPARAHHLVLGVHLGLEPHVLAGEVYVLEGVAQREQDAVRVERLLEEIVGAELGRFDGGLDGAVARDHHDLRARVELAQLAQRLEAVHALHLDVEQHEVGPELGVEAQRLGAGGARAHFEVLVLEQLGQRLTDALLVVHDQHAPAHVFLRLKRYSTTPVGWMATSVKVGETRSGTAPLESAPATRCASCFTRGPGNGKPRSDSSATVNRPTPGRSIASGPAMRSGSIGRNIPASGPSASGGMTRVSRRQYTARVPSSSSTRSESKLLRTDQSIPLPIKSSPLTTAVRANSSRPNAGSSPAKSRGWASRRARPRVTWGRNGRASVENPSGANSCSTRCCRISSPGSGAIPAHTTRGRRKSGNTPNPASASGRVRAPAAARPSAAVISASRSSPTSPRNLSVRWMPSPRTQFTGSPSSRSGAVAAHSAPRTAGGRVNATNSLTRSRGKPARRAGCRGGSPAGRARRPRSPARPGAAARDRKSTRLNSSHVAIS